MRHLLDRIQHSRFAFALAAFVVLTGAFAAWNSTPLSEFSVRARDGAAWLPSFAIGGVSLLDGASGSTVTSLAVVGNDELFEVIDWHDHAIIVNRAAGTLARLDSASWTIPGIVQVASPGEPMTVAVGDSTGWLLQPNTVTPLDPMTLSIRQPLPISTDVLDAVVLDDGSLLYSSTEGGPVQRLRPAEDQPSNVDGLGGRVSFQRLDPNTIAAVDLDSTSVWIEGRGEVCDQLPFLPDASLSIGGGEGELFVVSDGGVGFVWDPLDAGCPDRSTDFVSLGPGDYQDPVVVGTWGAVADARTGEVIVVTLESPPSVERVQMTDVDPGEMVDLIGESGSIWYNAPATANAGLVQPDGTLLAVTKYGDEGFTAAEITDPDDISVAGMEQEPDDIAASPTTTTPPSTTTPPPGDSSDADQVTTTSPAPADAGESTTTSGPPGEDPTTTSSPLADDSTTSSAPVSDSPTSTTIPIGLDPTSTSSSTSSPAPPADALTVSLGVSALQPVIGESVRFSAVDPSPELQDFRWEFNPANPEEVQSGELTTVRRFTQAGPVTVVLTGCTADDRCASDRRTITVVSDESAVALKASFTAPERAIVGEPIDVVDSSLGSPDRYRWEMTGASPATSTQRQPSISWSTPGTKTITLTVERDEPQAVDQITRTVVVEDAGTPSPFGLRCSATSVPIDDSVVCTLDGTTSDFESIAWDITPGTAAIDTSGGIGRRSIRPTALGTITVRLSAVDKATGDPVSTQRSITVSDRIDEPPTPLTITGPASAEEDSAASFAAGRSAEPGSSFQWSATGDPSIGSRNGSSTSITWPTPGTHTVTLTESGTGLTATKSVTVSKADVGIEPPDIELFFQFQTSRDCYEDASRSNEVYIVNSGGPIDSTSWSFSGNQPLEVQTMSETSWRVTFCNAGSSTGTLAATGPGGSSSDSLTFTADLWTRPGIVDHLPAEQSPRIFIGRTLTFGGNVGGDAVWGGHYPFTATWDFGDGRTATETIRWGSNPSQTVSWSLPGDYAVTLRVSNANGSDSYTWNVLAYYSDVVITTSGPQNATVGIPATYTARLVEGPADPGGYYWAVNGVTQPESSWTFTYTFPSPGIYEVAFVTAATGGYPTPATVTVTEPVAPDPLVVNIAGPTAVNGNETHTYVAQIVSGRLTAGVSWSVNGSAFADSGSGTLSYTFPAVAAGVEEIINIAVYDASNGQFLDDIVVTAAGPAPTTTSTTTAPTSTTTTTAPSSTTTTTTTTTTEP